MITKKKGKVSLYIKANRKGSREAELALSAGWTSKTKVHKNKKKYDRKDRNWQNDSGLSSFKRALLLLVKSAVVNSFVLKLISL